MRSVIITVLMVWLLIYIGVESAEGKLKTEEANSNYNQLMMKENYDYYNKMKSTKANDLRVVEKVYSEDFTESPEQNFAGGSGTKEAPYQVETLDQLQDINKYLDAHFKQTADIDLEGLIEDWEPIGDEDNPFAGTYDGAGYQIKNLLIEDCLELPVKIQN